MSRSFKHTIGFCDRNTFAKKEANARVRRTTELPNGNAYKKVFCSYNIHDFKCLFYTRKDWENWAKTFNQKIYKARMK